MINQTEPENLFKNRIPGKKFYRVSVYEVEKLQHVRFWIKCFTTRQTLIQKILDASLFESSSFAKVKLIIHLIKQVTFWQHFVRWYEFGRSGQCICINFGFSNGDLRHVAYYNKQTDPNLFIKILRYGTVFGNVLQYSIGFAIYRDKKFCFNNSFLLRSCYMMRLRADLFKRVEAEEGAQLYITVGWKFAIY